MTKSGRQTQTGSVLEEMLIASLKYGGYSFQGPICIGVRPHGLKHYIDKLVVSPEGAKFLVSAKWQQGRGSVEEKVPYEVICLADAVRKSNEEFKKAYFVIGGEGWRSKLKEWYLTGGLRKYLDYADVVEILNLDRFVAKANSKQL